MFGLFIRNNMSDKDKKTDAEVTSDPKPVGPLQTCGDIKKTQPEDQDALGNPKPVGPLQTCADKQKK
jgi:hypothetical protein